jgi:RHS repeat-associated protein
VDKKIGEQKQSEQKPCDEPTTGQPVVIATGNKIKPEVDFVLPPDQNPLSLVRLYDKSLDRIGIFGKSWASSIEYSLSFEYGTTFCAGRLDAAVACSPTAPLSKIYAVRTSGFALVFQNQGGVWTDGKNTISSVGGQWVLILQDGGAETYNGYGQPLAILDARGIGLSYSYSAGKLSAVTHTSGRSIQIGWSGTKVGTVTAPNSKTYTYTYSGTNLVGVTYPDSLGNKTYHYEDSSQPGGLTGISINGIRYTRYAYKADGRAAWSGFEGGAERSTFTYGADYTDVANAMGQTTRYQVADFNGSKRTIGIERPASSTCAIGARYTAYDINGNIDYELDAFGVKTDYTYDADGHPTQIITGIGPTGEVDQQLITQYVWDNTHKGRLNQVKVFGSDTGNPRNTTTYAYYPDGDVRARLLQSVAVTNQAGGTVGTLTTTYNYTLHPNGLIATMTVDGPLPGAGDSTVWTFDTAGNLLTVKNSLNHTTTYAAYNALGQPGTITSPNGAVATYTYNARGQVLTESRTVDGVVHTTTTTYDTRGRPVTVVTPDATRLDTSYDAFDRVTSVFRYNELPDSGDPDEPGDAYDQSETRERAITYNLLSQPLTVTTTYTYFGREWDETRLKPIRLGYTQTQRKETYEYDAGGFLSRKKGEHGQVTTYHYNANGDVDSVQDALGNTTSYGYDRHRRVSSITDPSNGVTVMGYNATGQVKSVRDPRLNTTTYAYDGLGNLLSQSSPDTGTTTFFYNALGQRTQMQRADMSLTDYTYDTLGRLTSTSSGGQTRTLTYDFCTGGKGLLCTASQNSATPTLASFTYTPWGQVATRQDTLGTTTDTTGYNYDGMLRLAGISYPSGISVGYAYGDSGVALINATVNGTTTGVLGLDAYQFLGPPVYMSYGNGLWRTTNYDTDGRITGISTTYSVPIQSLTYGFDAADRITAITDGVDAGLSQQFQYDGLSRLKRAEVPGGNIATFAYDGVGNRTSVANTAPAETTTYAIAGISNRMTQATTGSLVRPFVYNANGDVTSLAGLGGATNTLTYDPFGRLASHTRAFTTTYTVNALDQRMGKSNSGGSSRYVYAGYNQLLAEYTNGQWTSYIWNGNTPVAMVRNNQIYYIQTDHLGRPQMATDANRNIVWKASNYAFNRNVAIDTIGGLNLGFPGQYYDVEFGTWHNGYRDYLADTGRYLQSDPLGLEGDGTNTYAYGVGNPVENVDPDGLQSYPTPPDTCIFKEAIKSLVNVSPLGILNVLSDDATSLDQAAGTATSYEYASKAYDTYADKRDARRLQNLRQPFSRYPNQQRQISEGIRLRKSLSRAISNAFGKPLFAIGLAVEANNFYKNVNENCLCDK